MQSKFLKGTSEENKKGVIQEQLKVLEDCVQDDIPVIVIEYCGYGKTIEALREKLGKVKRVSHFSKSENDAFSNPALQIELDRAGVGKLLLMGVNANYCVKATACAAVGLGYEIVTATTLIMNSDTCYERKICSDWYRENGTLLSNSPRLVEIV